MYTKFCIKKTISLNGINGAIEAAIFLCFRFNYRFSIQGKNLYQILFFLIQIRNLNLKDKINNRLCGKESSIKL